MSKLKFRLPDSLARALGSNPVVDELAQRVNRVVEGILENEALTADLDDAAAKVLLNWGIACAEMIAHGTVGLNDTEAEEVMSPRLRPTRRLMRLVNKWVAGRKEMDVEGSAALLAKIVEQAAIIYGQDFAPPDAARLDAFLSQQQVLIDDPQAKIESLRDLLENSIRTPGATEEEHDDQDQDQEI